MAPVTPDRGRRTPNGRSPHTVPYLATYGFPVPYHANFDFNSSPNRTISFQMATITPYRVSRLLNGQSSHTMPAPSSNGFPVPYHANFDLNSSPKSIADIASNGTISFQMAPVTPDRDRRPPNGQSPQSVNLVIDERENDQREQEDRLQSTFGSQEREPMKLCSNKTISPPVEKLLQPMEQSPSVLPSSSKENQNLSKGGDDYLDLNKTPPQKPKRRKHRPKVIIEGKPKRTPKQPDEKETPRAKRKYVRKSGPKVSATPPADVELVDLGSAEGQKSCRRALNFNLETQAGDGSPSTVALRQEELNSTRSQVFTTPPTGFEVIDLKSMAGEKSCRRVLNFNSEGHARNQYLGKTPENSNADNAAIIASHLWGIRQASDSSAQEKRDVVSDSTASITNLQFDHGLEQQVENSMAGLVFDLNHSLTQWQDGYILQSENPSANPSTPISRREPSKENMKDLDRKKSSMEINGPGVTGEREHTSMHQSIHPQKEDCMISTPNTTRENYQRAVPSKLWNGLQYATETQQNLNSGLHVPSAENIHTRKRSKREYSHTVSGDKFHSMTLNQSHPFPMHSYKDILHGNICHRIQFPEIYKKQRTETRHSQLISNVSSSLTADLENFARRGTENSGNKAAAATSHLKSRDGRPFPQSDIMNPNIEAHNGTRNTASDVNTLSVNTEHAQPAQLSYREVLSCISGQNRVAPNELRATEGMLGIGQIGIKIKKRSKGSVRVCNLASIKATPPKIACDNGKESKIFYGPHACMEALAAEDHAKLKRKRHTKKARAQHANSISFSNQWPRQEHETATYTYHQSMVDSNGPYLGQKFTVPSTISSTESQPGNELYFPAGSIHKPMATYLDFITEIVQHLECLNINGSGKFVTAYEQKALVPYRGDGKMVPYERSLDPTKRQRARPKVDLDPETNRVWKLLMWKEGSEDTEGMDAAKEKWWEEERRIFRGRADSFIARMHLVQGDRRFTMWKGSVVDSVVGVFLTQNVSDHLSSSAFMALAARFPLKSRNNNTAPDASQTAISAEERNGCIIDIEDTIKWSNKMLNQQICDQSSTMFSKTTASEDKEITNSNESFETNFEAETTDFMKGNHLGIHERRQEICRESPDNRMGTPVTVMEGTGLAETGHRISAEDVVSSQSSVVSSQNSSDSPVQVDRIGPNSGSNSEAENWTSWIKGLESSTSFMELLLMAETRIFPEFNTHENGCLPSQEQFGDQPTQRELTDFGKTKYSFDRVDGLKCSSSCNTHQPHRQQELGGFPSSPSSGYHLHPQLGSKELNCMEVSPLYGSRDTEIKTIDGKGKINGLAAEKATEFTVTQNPLSHVEIASPAELNAHMRQNPSQPESSLGTHPLMYHNLPRMSVETSSSNCTSCICSELQTDQATTSLPKARESDFQSESNEVAEPRNHAEDLAQRQIARMLAAQPNFTHHIGKKVDTTECSSLVDNQGSIERKVVKGEHVETTDNTLKEKKGRNSAQKKKDFDWDSLRRQACGNGTKKERNNITMDSLDWDAVRCADVKEIADTIRERGMNNMLAERIKDFLNRLVRDHGSIDLEWLKDVPPDKAKEYLLSIRGLGLKSVECVRLLTLHHLAFPVDTNVGRICVRLGWVPLQPLPESLQLHLLELYPMLETIQKYLWPRLCKLDQRTLYELHYQMITFGKVFCTKSKPNCNACPMRAECKHFASAFASARLALPAAEEKSVVPSAAPFGQGHKVAVNPMPLLPLEGLPRSQAESTINKPSESRIRICEPIIEEPATPEPESIDTLESAIEDAFWQEDPEEIPTIKLNFEELTMNVQSLLQENNMEIQDGDMSRALVALTPEAASIPTPKLKNVSRLRTEHQVYELPDSHPLLKGLDRREPDDPCPYLLAIWTPGETAQSIQPPENSCNCLESDQLCDKKTCFSCNSIREASSQTVRGTLLIPCRTAMRGSFPLNGTYFQVNEVFADHDSSLQPMHVPRSLIWNLPRRTVFFGTSIPTIFRGLTTEGIQHCFWRGFVCVRGFEQKTRAPRPLIARLHFPASKLVRPKKNSTNSEE